MMVFCYPKCSTCQRALKWLNDRGITYTTRHIVDERPTRDEIAAWHRSSGIPLRRFFNTSGMLYRDMGLKDRLATMTDDEQLDLLASNGMLVRRPVVIDDGIVLVGFKEAEWEAALSGR